MVGRLTLWERVSLGRRPGEGMRGGTSPGREDGTLGTAAAFEHAIPWRCDAGHSALRGISVRRAMVCEPEHCSLILSRFLALFKERWFDVDSSPLAT